VKEQRKKIWIDRFQTRLSLSIALYFAVYQVAIWSLVVIERHVAARLELLLGQGTSGLIVFMTATVAILGLLFIYDAIRLSHRLVGPLYRFRKTIQAITAGDAPNLVTLRKGDFLQEMKDELNAMLKVLEERGAISLAESPAAKSASPGVAEEVYS
jgi:hypothetical protein